MSVLVLFYLALKTISLSFAAARLPRLSLAWAAVNGTLLSELVDAISRGDKNSLRHYGNRVRALAFTAGHIPADEARLVETVFGRAAVLELPYRV